MIKLELEVSQEVAETAEQEAFELSLSELDMVGGGNASLILA